jgi:hypothetical protein
MPLQFIRPGAVRQFCHDKGKRISKNALIDLDSRVRRILISAISNCRSFATIRGEVNH